MEHSQGRAMLPSWKFQQKFCTAPSSTLLAGLLPFAFSVTLLGHSFRWQACSRLVRRPQSARSRLDSTAICYFFSSPPFLANGDIAPGKKPDRDPEKSKAVSVVQTISMPPAKVEARQSASGLDFKLHPVSADDPASLPCTITNTCAHAKGAVMLKLFA